MLKLTYYQFGYSKRQWLGTLPLLFMSSLIVAISIIGTSNAVNVSVNAAQLFQMFIFFGGLTLFLLVSNLIQFLIDIFKKDYQLWTILGASEVQLAFIVSGQIFIIAFVASLLGTIFACFAIGPYYGWLQALVGKNDLPDLVFSIDILSILASLLLVPIISSIAGYHYTRRALKKNILSEEVRQGQIGTKKIGRLVYRGVILALWLACVGYLFYDTGSDSLEILSQQASIILLILLVHLLIIQMITPWIQTRLIQLSMKFPGNGFYATVISKWKILYKSIFFRSLQSSITMGITLTTGFLLLVQNLFLGNASRSAIEAKVSFLAYMLTPLFLILSNVISITILDSTQDKKDIQQLAIFGVAKKQLAVIVLTESFIQTLLVNFVSFFFNLLVLFIVKRGVGLLHQELRTITGLWLPGLVISLMLMLIIATVKLAYCLSSTNNVEQI